MQLRQAIADHLRPARGIIAASSPYDNAAATVSTPVITHESNSQPELPTSRAIDDDTIKMPDPIIDPATSIVESKRPKPRLSPLDDRGSSARVFIVNN